ncbi:hypothetical protein [Corynebacterium sp. HMSC28B08]|uniref:hypothetical protein n=1 Tax=Corynebacterium TaxID=1716 RepID=UPI000A4FE662|nr:hypothetical protein [Corynebacterium sp. HMSC28B08]
MFQNSWKLLAPLLITAATLSPTMHAASAESLPETQGGDEVTITSPENIDALNPDRDVDFTPRITTHGEPGSVTTIPVAGGEQTVFTIDSPDDPHSRTFDLNLPKEATIVERDGFFFVEQNGGIAIRISEPWAKDAHGRNLETWFTTDGKELTQHVEKNESATYPITADPRWNWGNISGHIYFSKEETRKLAAGAAGAAAVGPFWLAVPPPFGPAIAGWWAKNSIHVTETATRAVAGKKCVQLKVGYIGISGIIGVSPAEYTEGCS